MYGVMLMVIVLCEIGYGLLIVNIIPPLVMYTVEWVYQIKKRSITILYGKKDNPDSLLDAFFVNRARSFGQEE